VIERIEPLRERLRGWWESLDDKRRHFWKNVTIGLGLAVALQCLELLGVLAPLKQFGLDWQIATLSGEHHGERVAFIDIDEASELKFGAAGGPPPYFTPRDQLAKLIAAAVDAGAAAVVVDVDLSEPAGDPVREAYREVTGRPAAGDPAAIGRTLRALAKSPPASLDSVQRFFLADWQLSDYLASRTRACAAKPIAPLPGSCVPIILARPVGTSTTFKSVALPSFLDAAAPRDSKGVFWGSVTFDHDPDFVVRRWRLWEPACDVDGTSDVLPASALLAYALGKPLTAGDDRVYDRSALQATLAPADCRGVAAKSAPREPAVRDIALTTRGVERTLRYFISWRDGVGPSLDEDIPADGVLVPGYKLDIDCRAATSCVRGKRIVVIGSTYRNNGDFHRVPGGEMPGSLVLINEIDSLTSDHPVLHEAPVLLSLFLEAILVVGLAWAFMVFDPTFVLAAALLLTLGGLLGSSLLSLENGEWFDLAVPCIGIQIHEWVARAEHFRLRRGHAK
jgi:hypothetical protein